MAPRRSTRRRVFAKEESIINSLPRELIEHVFLTLPASCLLQCVTVCKKWLGIIRDPQFALAHLQHAPSCTLLFSPRGSVSGQLYPSDAIIFDEALSPSTLAVPVIGPDDLICGSCNGLLCLHTHTSTIKVANIATGECLHLKKPVKKLKDDHFSFYRFGFHPDTKQYRVIHFLPDSNLATEGRSNIIQVYTLGDERWKDVPTPEALSLNCVKESGVIIVDGTMYWLTEDRATSWQHAVMSFDLSDESFAKIPLPAVDLHDIWAFGVRRYWIIEIDGKVCVSTAQTFDGVLIGKLQIWTLSGKVDKKWNEKCSIQLSSLLAWGLHFLNGDKILIQSCDASLYSYVLGKNSEIELSKMVKLLDLRPRGECGMQFYVCVKSLVPLHVYAKAATVYRPKRLGEWKLKKWKAWEHENFMINKLWRNIHQMEHVTLELRHYVDMGIKMVSQRLPDDASWQRISAEIDVSWKPISVQINQTLQHLPRCSDRHPMPVRRINWVEKTRDIEKLEARADGLKGLISASGPALKEILVKLGSYTKAYCECVYVEISRLLQNLPDLPHEGTSSSDSDISS